jgi:hypothetical protein
MSTSLQSLDDVWLSRGLVGRDDKRVDNMPHGRVLGMEFRDGKRIQTRGSKLLALMEGAVDLSSRGSCSPADMAIFNGHLQWQNLVNRPLYSCLDAVYGCVHLKPEKRPRSLPHDVLSDLFLNISLFCFWSADLCRPWWNVIPCTDASPSFGFGMALAKCDPAEARALAAASADPRHMIRLRHESYDPPECRRDGVEYRSSLAMSEFKDVFSIRAKVASHSGAMEMQAVKLGLLRLTRSSRLHRMRGSFLVDAQVVCGVLAKGRSSAATMKRGAMAVAAISLACELKLFFPYVPSESNPSDFASRGKTRWRSAVPRRSKAPQPSVTDLRVKAYRASLRRLRQCGSLVGHNL